MPARRDAECPAGWAVREFEGHWLVWEVDDPDAGVHVRFEPRSGVSDLVDASADERRTFWEAVAAVVEGHGLSWYGLAVRVVPGRPCEVHLIQGLVHEGARKIEFQVFP